MTNNSPSKSMWTPIAAPAKVCRVWWKRCSGIMRRPRFFFSLGPDHTGRAIKRVFRPGFIGKVSRTSVVEHYGIKTLLYGTLLPGPDIGKSCADIMRMVQVAGFEVGIHCYDHIRWQDHVANKDAEWTRKELQRAVDRYTEIFGEAPHAHAAAGWQMNRHALRHDAAPGFRIQLGYARHASVYPDLAMRRSLPVRNCPPPCRRWTN